MPILTIDARDWLRGASVSDEVADGGFSPLSKGINLFATAGLLLPGQAPTDATDASAATNGVFGWASRSDNSDVGNCMGSNASDDGKFYNLGPTGAVALAASDTGHDYVKNQADLIRYGNEMFVTSKTTIGKCNAVFGTNDFVWWTTTLGLTPLGTTDPHPMVEFGGILYIADGRYIHAWDGAAGTYNALDLPATYVISALAVYNNQLFIAASNNAPADAADATNVRIFTWDGFSASFLDEFVIQERIDAFIPFGGTLFVTTKKYLGYFTGSTVSPLYPLTTNVYKYQYAITNDRLYMLQGTNVLCFGNPIISRPKFFSFPLKHTSTLVGLTSLQLGKLIYSYESKTGGWSDVNGSDQTGNIFYSNRVPFGVQARVRAVILEHEALASGSSITVEYIDDTQTARSVGTLSYANYGAITKYRFTVLNKPATHTIQLKLTFGATPNKGVRRVHIWWEPSELRENK